MRVRRVKAFAALMIMACAGGCTDESEIEVGRDVSQASAALNGPAAVLQAKTPNNINYIEGEDFSGFVDPVPDGNTVSHITAVNIGAANSGCNASDFAGFPAGDIALIRRGTCMFANKVLNAQAVGASGVLIFNDEAGLITATLSGAPVEIPALFITEALGNWLVSLDDPSLRVHMLVRKD